MNDILNDNQKLALVLELFNAGDISNALKIVKSYRKKGKWIDSGEVRKIGGYSADCSVCGEWSEYLTNFCGNCGADMRGE